MPRFCFPFLPFQTPPMFWSCDLYNRYTGGFAPCIFMHSVLPFHSVFWINWFVLSDRSLLIENSNSCYMVIKPWNKRVLAADYIIFNLRKKECHPFSWIQLDHLIKLVGGLHIQREHCRYSYDMLNFCFSCRIDQDAFLL